MLSADPVPIGGDSVWTQPSQEDEMMDHITVKGQGGTFSAYIARPKTSPASAVVVLQELFGVNADIRRHCDELAEQGYLAVAPDLYWRQEPGVDLNVTSEADWQHGLRLYSAHNRDAGAMDVKDTIDPVRSLPGVQWQGCHPWLFASAP
jgi:carboxymethylenebutenolidase